jgi:cytochrome b
MAVSGLRRLLVWDLPTRLFHWTLVLAVAGCWWTGERGPVETHALFGYAVLALLLFRLGWGLVGSETARFSSFVRGPRAALGHLGHLVRRGPLDHPVGHNAVGGYAVILLLLLLSIVAVSGLFLYDDEIYWAPLNAWVSEETAELLHEVHHEGFELLLVLIAVHVLAVIYYYAVKRLDLIRPMLTGRADLPVDTAPPRIAPAALALSIALAAAASVWALVAFAA